MLPLGLEIYMQILKIRLLEPYAKITLQITKHISPLYTPFRYLENNKKCSLSGYFFSHLIPEISSLSIGILPFKHFLLQASNKCI